MTDTVKTAANANVNTIAFVGDSVLDNFYWLDDPKMDARQQLANMWPNTTVYNFAVDESQIMDVINGIKPLDRYTEARKQHFGDEYPYPVNSKDGTVYPLKLLKQEDPDYTIISAGGNDGRVHLDKLFWSAESLIDAVVADGLEDNFDRMLRKVRNNTTSKKMILILVYQPHETIFERFRQSVGWGLQYLPIENVIDFAGRLNTVYDHFRAIFIKKAIKYNVPIIDLSRTFNPKDRSHYGSTPIEPSNMTGQVICNLITHVILHHKFDKRPCMYYAPNCTNAIKRDQL